MNDTREIALKQDELKLSKQDVLDMMDGLIKNWQKTSSKLNFICIQTTRGFKVAIIVTPEKVIEEIWNKILKFFNKILFANQAFKDSKDSQFMKKTFEKIKQEVKDGNFD